MAVFKTVLVKEVGLGSGSENAVTEKRRLGSEAGGQAGPFICIL